MNLFWHAAWNGRANLRVASQNSVVACEPSWTWEPEAFEDFDYWLVLDGTGAMRIGEVEYTVSAGFSACLPPGDHQLFAWHQPTSPLRVFYSHFDLHGIPRKQHPTTPTIKPLYLSPMLLGLVDQWSRSNSSTQGNSLREVILWQMLLLHEREQEGPLQDAEDRVSSIVAEIRENPAAKYDVEVMARRAALSPGHFRRVFRRLTGESPMRYVAVNRMKRACYYLAETKLPISEIADVLGYADIAYFSRNFKELTGHSPSAWRSDQRPEREDSIN